VYIRYRLSQLLKGSIYGSVKADAKDKAESNGFGPKVVRLVVE
jgi:hypothetical protein